MRPKHPFIGVSCLFPGIFRSVQPSNATGFTLLNDFEEDGLSLVGKRGRNKTNLSKGATDSNDESG